jgi:Antp family protein
MSPYANHHLHQTRTAQDSPYDASITAACKQIYDGAYNKDCSKTVATGAANGTSANSGSASAANNNTSDTNGYKDVWNSTGNNGSQNSAPVRPSACTPDSRVGGYIDASGGSPVSRTGSSATGGAWNTNCTIGTTGSQSSASASLHQNHTFYPWMAIAGECRNQCWRDVHLPVNEQREKNHHKNGTIAGSCAMRREKGEVQHNNKKYFLRSLRAMV